MMTAEKLIPFDIEIALREPERVRHYWHENKRVKQIAHFPESDLPFAVLWEGKRHLFGYRDDELRLTAKKRTVYVRMCRTQEGILHALACEHATDFGAYTAVAKYIDDGPTAIEVDDE